MLFLAWGLCSGAAQTTPHVARTDKSGSTSVICSSLAQSLHKKINEDVMFKLSFFTWVEENCKRQRCEDQQVYPICFDATTKLIPVSRVSTVLPLPQAVLSVRVVQPHGEEIVNIEPRNYTYFISPSSSK
jgi:hypothetical protein